MPADSVSVSESEICRRISLSDDDPADEDGSPMLAWSSSESEIRPPFWSSSESPPEPESEEGGSLDGSPPESGNRPLPEPESEDRRRPRISEDRGRPLPESEDRRRPRISEDRGRPPEPESEEGGAENRRSDADDPGDDGVVRGFLTPTLLS